MKADGFRFGGDRHRSRREARTSRLSPQARRQYSVAADTSSSAAISSVVSLRYL